MTGMGRLLLASGTLAALLMASTACHRPVHHPPPPHHVVGGPHLVAIAGTGVYYAEGYGDVFYYNGYWYWCDGPYWYRSATWGGTWIYWEPGPPVVFLHIPPGHRYHYIVYRHPRHPRYHLTIRDHYPDRGRPVRRRVFGGVRQPTYRRVTSGRPGSPFTGKGVRRTAPQPDRPDGKRRPSAGPRRSLQDPGIGPRRGGVLPRDKGSARKIPPGRSAGRKKKP